jgi:hypothetical protein
MPISRRSSTSPSAATPRPISGGGVLHAEDYRRCLDAAEAAGFRGPFTLIYDGPNADEFRHLLIERDFIRQYFTSVRATAV